MPTLIRLPYGDKDLLFIFGPYGQRLPGTYGVKLAENHQVPNPCDYHFPIRDFGVPSKEQFQVLLAKLILTANDGHVVYVGCFGGIGRTGMVLGGLVRVLRKVGGDRAIEWARANYLSHTIETRAQEALIRDFDVAAVRNAVKSENPVAASCISRYVRKLFGKAKEGADDTSFFP